MEQSRNRLAHDMEGCNSRQSLFQCLQRRWMRSTHAQTPEFLTSRRRLNSGSICSLNLVRRSRVSWRGIPDMSSCTSCLHMMHNNWPVVMSSNWSACQGSQCIMVSPLKTNFYIIILCTTGHISYMRGHPRKTRMHSSYTENIWNLEISIQLYRYFKPLLNHNY